MRAMQAWCHCVLRGHLNNLTVIRVIPGPSLVLSNSADATRRTRFRVATRPARRRSASSTWSTPSHWTYPIRLPLGKPRTPSPRTCPVRSPRCTPPQRLLLRRPTPPTSLPLTAHIPRAVLPPRTRQPPSASPLPASTPLPPPPNNHA